MLKKVLITLFIGIITIFSINNVGALTKDNPYVNKFDKKTLITLEGYSKDFSKLDIIGLTSVLEKLDFALIKIKDKNQKLVLKYLSFEAKTRLQELTNLKIDKLDKFYNWLKTQKTDKLKKILKILKKYQNKYKDDFKKSNAIYFLEFKTKKILDYKLKNSCIYKGEYYLKNNYIPKTKISYDNGFTKWLICDSNKKIIMNFEYKNKNGYTNKNNQYKGKDVLSVYNKVYTADYLIKNYKIEKNNNIIPQTQNNNQDNINSQNGNKNNQKQTNNNGENNKLTNCDGKVKIYNFYEDKILCMPKGGAICKLKNGKYYAVADNEGNYSRNKTIQNCIDYNYNGNLLIRDSSKIKQNILLNGDTNISGTGSLGYTTNTTKNCNDNYMLKYGDLPDNLICRYPGKDKKGKDTLMNRSQTLCYFGSGSLEKITKKGISIGKKIEEEKLECSENGFLIIEDENGGDKNNGDEDSEENSGEETEEDEECSEYEKKAASMHVSDWLPNGEPNFKCVSKDMLTCYMNDMHHFASSDHEITLFCDRHAEHGAVLMRGDEIFCTEGKKLTYPFSSLGKAKFDTPVEERGASCSEEGNLVCEIDGEFYVGESDEETEELCEKYGGDLSGFGELEPYTNYLCNEDTIFNNTLGENYICKAPLGTINYTIMSNPELSCIDIDNEVLKEEGEKNKFSADEKKEQFTKLKTYKRMLSFYKEKRGEGFKNHTNGMTPEEKNEERKSLDKSIEEYTRKKTEQEDEMMLFNSYKLDALGAKSISHLGSCSETSGVSGSNEAYGTDLKCTSAGLFGNTEDGEETEEEITVRHGERENIDNYFQYLSKSACGSDFVMKRKLTGSTIDEMVVEADCKDKDELSYEEDIIKECKEFGATELFDWVVYIKIKKAPKDVCDEPKTKFMRKYCSSEKGIESKQKREEERRNNIEKWRQKIEECATDQDAKTIKSCYLDNPHPYGQEEFNYKAVCSVEFGDYEGSLVESDDFEVIQPSISEKGKGVGEGEGEGECEGGCNGKCGGKGEKIGAEGNKWDWSKVGTKNTKGGPFILDNDFFDPDWVIMLQSALSIDKNGDAELVGVNLVSKDTNRKSGVMYDSIMVYNHRGNIPLGVSTRSNVRTIKVDATSPFPATQKYKGKAKLIGDFPSDKCLDGNKCPGRYDPVELICKTLKNSKKKVSYVTGGHLHNLADFLKETKKCNGKKLAEEKLKQVVISTGWNSRTNGKAETNLSGGKGSPDATKTVFRLMPKNVPIIIATVPGENWKSQRPGDVFINHKVDSPMSFILGVPRYGVYGDHGTSDTESLFYAVYGNKINGKEFTKDIKTCFNIQSNGAAKISDKGNCNHYYLEKVNNNYMNILGTKVKELMLK